MATTQGLAGAKDCDADVVDGLAAGDFWLVAGCGLIGYEKFNWCF
jgi:hypothetical protein